MGKKRDRRVGLNSDRQTERVESSSGESEKADSENRLRNQNRKRTAAIFTLLFIVAPAVAAIIYRIFQAPNAGSESNLPYVYERGLVKTEVNYRDILAVSILFSTSMFFLLLLWSSEPFLLEISL